KLYFLDTGLAAWLLGIQSSDQLLAHPARGALFETWVVAEMAKQRYNQGRPLNLYYWRDSQGLEVDVLFETPDGLQAIEIKSGATFASDWPAALSKWARLQSAPIPLPWVIYGGEGQMQRQGCLATGWNA
ncbi:DUF4143 domain-containing protein, partial [Arthrospira platensis SPKY1]|nr:DUF4143 domain-containing protein [Arthrospira platensis SPKY1]